MSRNPYPIFKGSIPALITPMLPNGEVDYEAFKKLVDWHVQEKSDGLVIIGTSGESPTIDFEEHAALLSTAVEFAAGRIPIIAGVGGNSTKEALHLTREAEKAGAQAGLSVAPYYNKPTQEGLYQHFKHIAENSDLPILLYNVPGRTMVDMSNETVLRLAEVQRRDTRDEVNLREKRLRPDARQEHARVTDQTMGSKKETRPKAKPHHKLNLNDAELKTEVS